MAAQDVAHSTGKRRGEGRAESERRRPILGGTGVALRELSLFTGAGGGLLGSLILGFRTVAAVEYDAYCQRLLCVRGGYVADDNNGREPKPERSQGSRGDGTGGRHSFPVYPDVRTFDGTAWRGKVDIVTGGFPCQPHSQAGKRLGGKDDRDLWPDTVRILRESGAPLGFFENVPGLLTSRDADGLPMFGRILGDLSEAGFDAEWCVLGADDVGAPHRRKRLWILAYSKSLNEPRPVGGGDSGWRPEAQAGDCRSPWWVDPADVGDADEPGSQGHGGEHELPAAGGQVPSVGAGEDLRDTALRGQSMRGPASQPGDERHAVRADGDGYECDPWLLEPYVGRVATGVASRVDRLRALGNGQVPQSMAWAFTVLARDAGVFR